MENSRFLDALAVNFDRLRAVAAVDPGAAVPSCPGWTVADLTHHVGEVYLHKTMAMRDGAEPDRWPPSELAAEEPLPLLDRAYTALRAELTSRRPEDPAGTWYKPDQTVGFWIRRMAHETVIHRMDGELGTGQQVTAVADDIAVDGIDELLKVFVAYGVREWTKYFAEVLGGSRGWTYVLRTGDAAWRVRTGPGQFDVEDGVGDGAADVTISGSPMAILRWVWNRERADEPSDLTVEGPADAVAELKRCIVIATQ